jgi:2-polyprenyl-3-methyl-5-hydroxy-6-metoxy-1,4-benzoquinol methylase
MVPRKPVCDKNTFVVDRARGKAVLHIGMGGFVDDAERTEKFIQDELAGSLHVQIAGVARSLAGFDIDQKTIDAMRTVVPECDYYLGDLTATQLPDDLAGRRFDLIVFGDVLEHLDNFRQALTNLKSLLAPGGQLLISTANAHSFDAFVKMMFSYESAHEEHTSYFSYLTLKRLLEMNRLALTDFRYYTHLHVKKYESLTHRISYTVSNNLTRLFPQYAMGVIAVAEPK